MKTIVTVCFAWILLSGMFFVFDARADMPLEGYEAIEDFNNGGFKIPGERVMEMHTPFTPCDIKHIWRGTAKPIGYFEQVLGPGTRLKSGTWNSGTDVIDVFVWMDSQTNLIFLKFNRGMMAEALTDKDYDECAL